MAKRNKKPLVKFIHPVHTLQLQGEGIQAPHHKTVLCPQSAALCIPLIFTDKNFVKQLRFPMGSWALPDGQV